MSGAALVRASATWSRLLGGVLVLAALVWWQGTGPFVAGVALIGAWPLLTALLVTSATTGCCALRWSLLARRLDVAVPVGAAVAACYRSQFLNATLPLGVLGDVHRGLSHGRSVGAPGRALRSVAWDRAAGQAVQVVLVVATVGLLPRAVQVPVAVVVLVAAAAAVALRGLLPDTVVRTLGEDLRRLRAGPTVYPLVVGASALAAAGHAVVFVVAARTAGVDAPLTVLGPLALLVLLASALPLGVAGWGPREGAAAWAFSALGLGAAQGVTVSVIYGVMALAATLPGAPLLLVGRGDRLRRPATSLSIGEVARG